jgi:hypothetical protein
MDNSFILILIITQLIKLALYFLNLIMLLEKENVVNNDKTMTYSQQAIEEEVETECKPPCPKSAEMCIEICA